MNSKRIGIAVVGLAMVWMPSLILAQMDSGSNSQQTQPAGQGMTQTGTAQSGQTGSMRDSLGAPGQTGQEMMDKQFMRNAAAGGIADIRLGGLATEKGSPALKELAQKMVDDHTTMNKEMEGVADSLGVMLPKKMSKDSQKEYDKLSALSGKDFDSEYLTYMAKAHFEDLHAFHMEASVAADEKLAAEVVKDMHTMHQHLGLIMDVARQEGIALPPRPQRPTSATTAAK
jgi:putative membrane protein